MTAPQARDLTPMQALLSPSSVAIVGASPGAGRGGIIHQQLLDFGFSGTIYPINPKYEEIRGVPAYPSLQTVPDDVDFVACALGAQHSLGVMEQCAEKGVRGALFIASGFAEAGDAGKRLQADLRAIAVQNDIAVCGPNCYGIANFHGRFTAYGGPIAQPMRPGATALVFQSGALTHGATEPTVLRRIGYSYIITTGNEAVTELADYVDAIADDPNTRVIACFVEGFKDPPRFAAAARRAIANGKWVVCLKIGRSQRARRAAIAHTGSLTGEDAAYDALFRRLGVVRVDDLDELIETVELLSNVGSLPPGGAAIASISGGSCGIVADLAEAVGLELAELSPQTRDRLKAVLPDFATVNNPLDFTGAVGERPEILDEGMKALAADAGVGVTAFAMNTPTATEEWGRTLYRRMAQSIVESTRGARAPVVLFTMSSGRFDESLVDVAREAGVPLLQGFRESLAALARAAAAQRVIENYREPAEVAGDPPPGLVDALSTADGVLDEVTSKRLLEGVGIPALGQDVARDAEEAERIAERIGYPVALKVVSPDIPHKTDAGGVRLDISSPAMLREAHAGLLAAVRSHSPDARVEGVLVERMAPTGVDMLVGVTNRDVGPVIVVGLGGVLVEAIGGVRMAMAPVTYEQAQELVDGTPAARLLHGFRGGPPADVDALLDVIVTTSKVAWWLRDHVAEIDLNPVRVLERGAGAVALDALIVPKSAAPDKGQLTGATG